MASGLAGLMGSYGSDESSNDSSDSDQREAATKDNSIVSNTAASKGSSSQREADTVSKGRANCSSDGDGYDSNSGDTSESGSEGQSSSNSHDPKRSKRPLSKIGLPSVDDLFSSTAGPDFLEAAPGAKEEFVVKTLVKKKKQKQVVNPSAIESVQNGSSISATKTQAPDGAVGPGALSSTKRPKEGSLGPSGPPANKEKKRSGVGGKERTSAKDKVKGQRMKGQSGIGSDFRVWKSDLEMTMRQQYD